MQVFPTQKLLRMFLYSSSSTSSSTSSCNSGATVSFCFSHISASCLPVLASSIPLSSRILINLGNRILNPRSSLTSPIPAVYTGLNVTSANLTSHTSLATNQTTFSPHPQPKHQRSNKTG